MKKEQLFDEIGKLFPYENLTDAQIRELIAIIQNPNASEEERKEAKNRLICAHTKYFCKFLWVKYKNIKRLDESAYHSYSNLIVMTLERAAVYDLSSPVKFSVYIRKYMNKCMEYNDFLVQVKEKHANLYYRMARMQRNFYEEHGRNPSEKEIISEMHITPKMLEKLKLVGEFGRERAKDTEYISNIKAMQNCIIDTDKRIAKEELMKEIVSVLTKDEAMIMFMCWGFFGELYEKEYIAQKLNMSISQIEYLQCTALLKLKKRRALFEKYKEL